MQHRSLDTKMMGGGVLMKKLVLLAFIVCYTTSGYHRVLAQSTKPQTMRVPPKDSFVKKDGTTILSCRVDNLKGIVQWAKDSMLLGGGQNRNLPGFSRYSMVGTEAAGEFDLMIDSAQLSDDGEYQCQVSPYGSEPALLGKAHLSVLVPPRLQEIEGYPNNSLVKVRPDEDTVNLTCVSFEGKEAAKLSWLRDGHPLSDNPDDDDDQTERIFYSTETHENKLEDARSVLMLRPEKTDNGVKYTCEGQNSATSAPMRSVVLLSVMHAPSVPVITGYLEGQVLKTGDTLRLVCTSRGGNPLPRVYWYRDSLEVDFSYTSGAGRADNELVFSVQPRDNGAEYRCDAASVVLEEPLSASVTLDVQFAPEKVTISGHQNAKAGEMITLKCTTAISNPPAVITWFSRGRQLTGAESMTVSSPQGGFVTTSEIQVELSEREDDVIYECHGTNDALGQTEVDTVTLEVMYPPQMPTISGYKGQLVVAEQIQILTCTAIGGNPPATLTWWRDFEPMESVNRIMGNIVTSKVSFILKPEDNTAEFRCNATNQATVDPLIATVQLQVNFPPASLDIWSEPAQARAGQPLVIVCKSQSSKPASLLSWWHAGSEVTGIDGGVIPAEHEGQSSISRLQLTPNADDDGEIYACSATNPLLKRAVSDAVTLDILYAPRFEETSPVTGDVVEFSNVSLNVTARANPHNITYQWYKDGVLLTTPQTALTTETPLNGVSLTTAAPVPEMTFDEGKMNIVFASRNHAGWYVCEASNAEGSTNISVQVNVLYGATVTVLPPHQLVDAGSNATFTCVSDANPSTEPDWSRTGYDMLERTLSYRTESGAIVLTVLDVRKEDSGVFSCSANNAIGEPGVTNAELVVKYAPEIDRSPTFSKAAADKGGTAKLVCKADGAPDITFKWFKDAQELDTTGVKYASAMVKTSLVHYESELMVFNITDADYSKYVCMAENEIGHDSTTVTLDGTSKPDPPFDLHIVNVTHNSATLGWTPGFDGGTTQWFQVRYSEIDVMGQKYEDVMSSTDHLYTVRGLKLATEYEMTVRAVNRLGASMFSSAAVRVKTALVAPQHDGGATDTPLIIILTVCIIGMLLLALNILLILFFIRRRRKKLEKESSESCSHANTVEMFSGPTSITDGSNKSYTSYDPRNIGDFPDDYRIYDDEDEVKRFIPPNYADMYPPGISMYQSLPHSERMPPSPDMDRHRAFIVPKDSHEPIYPNNPMTAGRNWLPQQTFAPYQDPRDVPDESHDYADQLRKRQIKANGTNAPATKDSRTNPPAPPQRSSSKGAVDNGSKNIPPVPSRNYQPEDVPRYGPAPSNAYAGNMRPGSKPSPDTLGHLV